MEYAADDMTTIAARLKEIEEEKRVAREKAPVNELALEEKKAAGGIEHEAWGCG